MLSSKFVHVVDCVRITLLFVVEQCSIMCIGLAKKFFEFFCITLWKNPNEHFGQSNMYILFIPSSANGHLGYLHFWSIVNNVVMNMGLQ